MQAYAISVGNKIRSYDFRGNDSCYMEGVVTEVGETMAIFTLTKQIWQGANDSRDIGIKVQTSIEKLPMWEDRIVILEAM